MSTPHEQASSRRRFLDAVRLGDTGRLRGGKRLARPAGMPTGTSPAREAAAALMKALSEALSAGIVHGTARVRLPDLAGQLVHLRRRPGAVDGLSHSLTKHRSQPCSSRVKAGARTACAPGKRQSAIVSGSDPD